jgi:hypothetical protein
MSLQLDLWDTREAVPAQVYRQLSITQAALRADVSCPPASWQPNEAARRLMLLCSWLQKHLDNPICISELPNDVRQIEVLGALVYRVESQKREISVGKRVDGVLEPYPYIFELGRPLSTHFALDAITEKLGLGGENQDGGDSSDGCEDDLKIWLTETAYRFLLRDPAFRRLRRTTLPKAFGLPRDIYTIALASRMDPEGPLLDSLTFNTVWRYERQFRQVARENPRLLPLLMAFVRAGFSLPDHRDPLATLKSAIRSEGHGDAAWRYVSRHGARMFRIPWAVANRQIPYEVALHYLSVLEFAGLPPPPPPSISTAFLHSFNEHRGNDARLTPNFHVAINPVALRAAMLEADKRRSEPNLSDFADEFLGVCAWSESVNVRIDKNQAKAGWSWFVRQQQAAEMAETAVAEARNATWKTRLGPQVIDGWEVVPLDSSAALIREALAMRNCLRDYLDRCKQGELEVYSVRQPETGMRKACIAFKFDAEGVPTLLDMKGFANTRPKGEFVNVMGELFKRLQT